MSRLEKDPDLVDLFERASPTGHSRSFFFFLSIVGSYGVYGNFTGVHDTFIHTV